MCGCVAAAPDSWDPWQKKKRRGGTRNKREAETGEEEWMDELNEDKGEGWRWDECSMFEYGKCIRVLVNTGTGTAQTLYSLVAQTMKLPFFVEPHRRTIE